MSALKCSMVKGFSGLLYAGNKANPGGMFPNGLGISQNIGSIYISVPALPEVQ